jgi:metallophosphoesterase (TIGR00282 family)
MIKILYTGDVCGKPGRKALAEFIPKLRKSKNIDLVICNIENLAHGKGATVQTVEEIMSYGVDFMTAGNHIWRKPDFEEILSGAYPVVRPINYPEDIPGKGYEIVDLGKKGKVLVSIVLGRAFLGNENVTTDMVRPLENMMKDTSKEGLSASIIEVHAESTSEKVSLGLMFDGKVSAILGTHTHVPTADERILPKGSGYITDLGMVGPMNSSLWVKPEIIFQQLKYPFAPAYDIDEDGPGRFDGVILEIDSDKSCKTIERVNKVL